MLAISRCFSGLIAAKPRFDPPLFVWGIASSSYNEFPSNAGAKRQFNKLIQVRQIVVLGPIHWHRSASWSVQALLKICRGKWRNGRRTI